MGCLVTSWPYCSHHDCTQIKGKVDRRAVRKVNGISIDAKGATGLIHVNLKFNGFSHNQAWNVTVVKPSDKPYETYAHYRC